MGSCQPRLTQLQRDLLEAFFARETQFALAGGTALGGFHLGHRQSQDLDLFADLRQHSTARSEPCKPRRVIAAPGYRPNNDFPSSGVSAPLAATMPRLSTSRVLVASPNSPSGTAYPADKLAALARALADEGRVLVIDEAYADCAIGTCTCGSEDGDIRRASADKAKRRLVAPRAVREDRHRGRRFRAQRRDPCRPIPPALVCSAYG
jgi:hypothetical protein